MYLFETNAPSEKREHNETGERNKTSGPNDKNQNLFELLEQWLPLLPRPEEPAMLQHPEAEMAPGLRMTCYQTNEGS